MTEFEKLQQMGLEVESLGQSRKDLACLKARARNYKLETERFHKMLCDWLGEDDNGIGRGDGKAIEQNTWPSYKDIADLNNDIMNRPGFAGDSIS